MKRPVGCWTRVGRGDRWIVLGAATALSFLAAACEPLVVDPLSSPQATATPSATAGVSEAPKPPPSRLGGGILWTDGELAEWRARAKAGPYRVANDAGRANTPGDWERILRYAGEFEALSPTQDLYLTPEGTGCMHAGSPQVGESQMRAAVRTQNAAFVALVNDDATLRAKVKARILAQARHGADFTDRSRWCLVKDDGSHNPFWGIYGRYLSKMARAYDYVHNAFTDTERAEVARMLRGAGEHATVLVDNRTAAAARQAANPDPETLAEPVVDQGLGEPGAMRNHNNRIHFISEFLGIAAELLDDARMRQSTQAFVKSYVEHGVDAKVGLFADIHRGSSLHAPKGHEHVGVGYGTAVIGHVIQVADAQARNGDTTLYDYRAPNGQTLLDGLKVFTGHVNGRYDLSQNGRPLGHYLTDWYPGDVYFLQANLYYRDAEISKTVLRAYPERPRSNGPFTVWQGPGAVHPGILLQWAGLEGKLSPHFRSAS
jgi:hypothetical protein